MAPSLLRSLTPRRYTGHMAAYTAQATLSSRALWPMLRAAQARGAQVADLLQGLVPAETFWSPDLRLDHHCATEIGLRAVAATGTSEVLLRAHEHIEAGDFGVLAYAGRSSATIADSIAVCDRYIRLMRDAVRTQLSTTDEHGVWRFELTTDAPDDLGACTYLMALLVRGGARIVGGGEHFTEVRMMAEEPSDADVFEQAWGVESPPQARGQDAPRDPRRAAAPGRASLSSGSASVCQ